MSLRKLQSGHLDSVQLAAGADGSFVDKPAMLVYSGLFESMDGPVTVTDDMLRKLVSNHNQRMALARNEGDFVPRLLAPVQCDHSTSAVVTVGRVLPQPLELKPIEIMGTERLAVFGAVRFLGVENVTKAIDGRFVHLSVGADFDAGVLKELSVVPFPAAAHASLLSHGDPMDKEKLASLKKRLMDKDKLSEKDADEKLSKMSDDEKLSALAKGEDEDKKLAAEEEEKKEKEKKDAELAAANTVTVTRLAAGKERLTKLGLAATESLKSARLAAKAGTISVRLAKLQSNAKITPAERKKIDVTALAAKGDDVVTEVLATYENRQPVIHVGQVGTVSAVDVGEVAKTARLAELEAETRANMKGKGKATKLAGETPAATVRLSSETEGGGKKTEELAQTVERFTSMVGDIEKAAQSGNIQDLMAKCKGLRDLMHFTAEGMAMPDADQHMASLAARVDELGTRLSEYQTAVTEVLGA